MNIIGLAKEAGFKLGTSWYGGTQMLERFAALVRAEALEEAAKVCDEIMEYGEYPACEAEACAAAIRGLK